MSKDQIIEEKDRQISHLTEENTQLSDENTQLSQANTQLSGTVTSLSDENLILKERVAWFERQFFGQKRERFEPRDPGQLSLELGQGEVEATAEVQTEEITYRRKKKKARKPPTGRKPWPAHLPRVEVYLYPQDLDLSEYLEIGRDITEELEYQPEKLFVRQFIRPRLLRKSDQPSTAPAGEAPADEAPADEAPTPAPTEEAEAEAAGPILQAPMVQRPLPKSSVGTYLLATLICDKYLDHLPLYRQMKRLERRGVKIAQSTLSGWIMAVCELLDPLFEANRMQVLLSDYLQADETRIQVLDLIRRLLKDGKTKKKLPPPGKSHRGYYWVYYAPRSGLAYFDYQPGRGSEYPHTTLADFEGILQTDGYQAYEAFDKRPKIILTGCLSHVRRKFFEAKDSKDADRVQIAMRYLNHCYSVERNAKERMAKAQSFDEAIEIRYQLRQRHILPLVEPMEQWLKEQAEQGRTLPQSSFGKAVKHALKRLPHLRRILNDGRIEIDNNLVENQIRPIALGRKNYLFAGSEKAAQNAGNLYSLLTAAKANGLNPVEYLYDIIETIADTPINQIQTLLPHLWKPNPDLPAWLQWKPKD